MSAELRNSRPFLLCVAEMVKFSIFMLSGSDCTDVTFAEQFKILNEENVGLPELSLTLSLKTQYCICNIYYNEAILWDQKARRKCACKHTYTSPLSM